MIIRVQGLVMVKITSPITEESQGQRARLERKQSPKLGSGDPSLPISLGKRHKRKDKDTLLYDVSL
jgi:hypothetical protein